MNTQLRYSPVTQTYSKAIRLRSKQLRRQMTLAELRLWNALRAGRLNGLHFRRQQPVLNFIVDFYCHRIRLVIEVDGPIHALLTGSDVERDQALQNVAITTLRFSNEQIFNSLDNVLAEILEAARQSRNDTSL